MHPQPHARHGLRICLMWLHARRLQQETHTRTCGHSSLQAGRAVSSTAPCGTWCNGWRGRVGRMAACAARASKCRVCLCRGSRACRRKEGMCLDGCVDGCMQALHCSAPSPLPSPALPLRSSCSAPCSVLGHPRSAPITDQPLLSHSPPAPAATAPYSALYRCWSSVPSSTWHASWRQSSSVRGPLQSPES